VLASGPRLVPVALGIVAARNGAGPSVVADSGKAIVGLDVVSEHPSKQRRPDYPDNDDSFRNIHDAASIELIPSNVCNFIGKFQGVCMGVAISGEFDADPNTSLMELVDEAQEFLLPTATSEDPAERCLRDPSDCICWDVHQSRPRATRGGGE
jgi:hypothetical protein